MKRGARTDRTAATERPGTKAARRTSTEDRKRALTKWERGRNRIPLQA